MEDRRLNKRAIGFACLLLDGSSTHDALQSREAEHACRITLVIGAGRGDDSRSTVLDIDYHHVPYRPDLAPVSEFYRSEEAELFFPVFSFLVPHQSPVSIKGGLVEVQQFSRIAVAWIFGRDLENVRVHDFPLFVQGQVIARLASEG